MKENIQNLYKYFYSARSSIYIALLCMIVLVLSTKGITCTQLTINIELFS